MPPKTHLAGLLLCLIGTLATQPAHADDETDTVFLKDRTGNLLPYTMYPPDLLRERGVRVPDIPRESNAAFRYFDAVNAYVAPDAVSDEWVDKAINGEWPTDPEQEAQLIAYLDANEDAINITREAAHMPDYFLPLFGNEDDSLYALMLPSLGPQRQIAKLLAIDAQRHVRDGHFELGMDRLLTAQRMGAQMGHGSTMIEGLVGVAITSLSADQFGKLADTYDIPTDVLINTTASMGELSKDLPSFEDLLRAERALSDQIIDDVLIDPAVDGSLLGVSAVPTLFEPKKNTGWHNLLKEVRRIYLPDRAIKRHVKHHYEKVLEGTRPKKDGTPGSVLEEDKLIEDVPAWDVLTRATLPSFSRVHELTLMNSSNFERTRLRVAARAYKQDHGSLPPDLQALTPTYLSNIPADPMTGYDFEYQAFHSDDGDLVGLNKVTRDNIEALKKKRRTPAILTPRASKWRRHVMRFADQYDFNDRQRASAEGILRDIEARAAAFERTQGAKIQQLIDENDHQGARAEMGPLDKLFNELDQRLSKLPTRKQRAAVENQRAKERN